MVHLTCVGTFHQWGNEHGLTSRKCNKTNANCLEVSFDNRVLYEKSLVLFVKYLFISKYLYCVIQ